MAGEAHEGEARSGDVAVFVPTVAGGLACVIDGLGHGPEAADAAELCADVVRANAEAAAQDLMQACHEALLDTRGAVMTAAWFDLERSMLSWAGVGNVDARLVRSGPELREEVALVFGGVLGYRMPRVRPATMALGRGDLLVMITDGIDAAISPALAAGGPAQALARRILDTHGKGSDDALAVVIRYR
jgi:negative regulator of sigma-B (phosphoserine phosphatase)